LAPANTLYKKLEISYSHAAFWAGNIAGKAVTMVLEAKVVAGRPVWIKAAEA